MRVKILAEFDVIPTDDNDGKVTENVAKSAASQVAYEYLSFCTVSDVNAGRDDVTVHVDGFGECVVRVGDDHE